MLKPHDPFGRRIQGPHIFLGQYCRRIDIMTAQEEIDGYIKPVMISSKIYVIKLLVDMVVCVDDPAQEVDFIKHTIFG